MTKMNKSYEELVSLETFSERLEYLRLSAKIGIQTFGEERFLNQAFYTSPEWRRFRREVILRDLGCDLGCDGLEIHGRIEVHHINPITAEDIENGSSLLMDFNNVICASGNTHKAIHYMAAAPYETVILERKRNDMCPWLEQ